MDRMTSVIDEAKQGKKEYGRPRNELARWAWSTVVPSEKPNEERQAEPPEKVEKAKPSLRSAIKGLLDKWTIRDSSAAGKYYRDLKSAYDAAGEK